MAADYAVYQMLAAGTTKELVQAVRVGELKEREKYPVVQVTSFSVAENCKDGEVNESYTVTVLIWAKTPSDCDDIGKRVKTDLVRSSTVTMGGNTIRGIKFGGRGPFILNAEKKYYGRPLDFQIYVNA
jgi:hypothetical protein